MDNGKIPSQNANGTLGKKEFRKQLADKIEAAISELKTTLGEKKFQHRIKKAVKHITEGLHKKEKVKVVKKAKVVAKKAAPKKAVAKKAGL
ncbi:MAG: hypothetical protein M3R72_09610 [Bacteroidota bacterium]|nr:hypothetical protein [Bacteroidota bacterium]